MSFPSPPILPVFLFSSTEIFSFYYYYYYYYYFGSVFVCLCESLPTRGESGGGDAGAALPYSTTRSALKFPISIHFELLQLDVSLQQLHPLPPHLPISSLLPPSFPPSFPASFPASFPPSLLLVRTLAAIFTTFIPSLRRIQSASFPNRFFFH